MTKEIPVAPGLSGPYFDSLVEELVQWWSDTVDFLVEALTEVYPFGSTKLTPEQQLENFLAMKEEDWLALKAQLALRYQGYPDAEERIQNDLADFLVYMDGLHRRLSGAG